MITNLLQRSGALLRALTAFLALTLSSISLASSPLLERIMASGVLRVGMSADQPPFNFYNRANQVVGFDSDLAKALAGAMQVKLKIVEIPFGDLLPALIAGQVDIVMSGMSITPERSLQVHFVGPYTMSGKSMLTTSRIKEVVKDPTQFNDSDIRVVALKNSTSEMFVRRNLPEVSLHTIAYYHEGIEQLLRGKIDAMVADVPILKLSMLRHPGAGLAIIEPVIAVEPIGMAIPENDPQFANLLRNYLSGFEKIGLTNQLRNTWFEQDDWIATLP
ncbi:MAG: transporter substrate-binding domain-containing protein [Halioglobus sp.]|nr:transporter substrate-binding domain-containing protein [Halioglobus sp.]